MKRKKWRLLSPQRGSVTWNINAIEVGLLSLWILSGCNLDVPPKPGQSSPVVRVSVGTTLTSPSASASTSPIASPSQAASLPTALPSGVVLPSFQPSTTPIPTVSPDPFAVYRHLDAFNATAFCLPLEEKTIKPSLKYPVDVAVSKDGSTVYVMNKRCDTPIFSRISSVTEEGCRQLQYKTENPIVKHEYIYKISKNMNIDIVKVNGVPPLSCQIGEDIEIDTQNNLYLNAPGKHRLYKIPSDRHTVELLGEYEETTSSQDEVSANCNSSAECAATGLLMGPYDLQVEGENAYFSLISPFMNSSNSGQLRQRALAKQLTELIKNNWHFFPYSIQATDLFFCFTNGIGKVSLLSNPGDAFTNCLGSSQCMFTGGGIYLHNGERYFSGEPGFIDGAADQARFKGLRALRIDASGYLYVIDLGNHAIRKVTPDGNVTTLAGNGQPGFKDGQGREAQFNYPTAIDLDDAGNLYVADTGNHAIRKITPDGLVTTFYAETNPN